MTLKSKKQILIVASDAGNIGKTLVASSILETLRKHLNVDAYVCDRNFQGLFERYGEKKNGKRIPLSEQNPKNGVAFLDISNEEEKQKFGSALGTNSDYVIFDLPANATENLATALGTPQDFLDFMEYGNAEPIFICPIKDQKSITSYDSLKATFPDQKFIVAINAGFIKATEPPSVAKTIIEDLKKKFKDVPHFVIDQTLSNGILDLLKNHTLREVYVPRIERKNTDGTFSQRDDEFLAKDLRDQFILDRFITDIDKEIVRLFM